MKRQPADYKAASCDGKVKYFSAKRARRQAKRSTVTRSSPICAYFCRFCKCWHLGEATHNLSTDFRLRKRELIEKEAGE